MREFPPRFWSSLFTLAALAAGVIAFLVLVQDAWIYVFLVLSLVGLLGLERRITGADGHLGRLRPDPRDRRRPLRSVWFWGAVQLAVVGFFLCAWAATYTEHPNDPGFGAALFLGMLSAWFVTAAGTRLGEMAGMLRRRLAASRRPSVGP